jgi:hypothetical protein
MPEPVAGSHFAAAALLIEPVFWMIPRSSSEILDGVQKADQSPAGNQHLFTSNYRQSKVVVSLPKTTVMEVFYVSIFAASRQAVFFRSACSAYPCGLSGNNFRPD